MVEVAHVVALAEVATRKAWDAAWAAWGRLEEAKREGRPTAQAVAEKDAAWAEWRRREEHLGDAKAEEQRLYSRWFTGCTLESK
jgi:hypothetical protein